MKLIVCLMIMYEKHCIKRILTDEIRYVIWLFVMLDGHEHCVEKHQHDDEPIEPLRFYHAADPKPKTFLTSPHRRTNAFFSHSVFERRCARETCGFLKFNNLLKNNAELLFSTDKLVMYKYILYNEK